MTSPRHAGMYVESPSRTYQAKDGSARTYRTHLLRRSFRDDGNVKKKRWRICRRCRQRDRRAEGVAVRLGAGGRGRYVRNRAVIAARACRCDARDGLTLGLKPARPRLPEPGPGVRADHRPRGRAGLETGHHRLVGRHHPGHRPGYCGASTDEVYAAMDWLLSRQDAIEKKRRPGTWARRPGIVRFVIRVAGRA